MRKIYQRYLVLWVLAAARYSGDQPSLVGVEINRVFLRGSRGGATATASVLLIFEAIRPPAPNKTNQIFDLKSKTLRIAPQQPGENGYGFVRKASFIIFWR